MSTEIKNKAVTFVVYAHSTCDDASGPLYARFMVTEAFLASVASLVELCNKHELMEMRRKPYAPEYWGPHSFGATMHPQNCAMVVDSTGDFWFYDKAVWFVGTKKHSGDIECRAQAVTAIQKLFEEAPDGSVVFVADEADGYLRELYEVDHPPAAEESSVCGDCGAHVDSIVGCPDGAEVCEECFDNGNH